mmetsp:Transcript_13556/g.51762  ORF Transcript_13556/g.51762 Transcript_13556/m.51762 type:complete len:220 (-) Transcript_13556:139-798(-)
MPRGLPRAVAALRAVLAVLAALRLCRRTSRRLPSSLLDRGPSPFGAGSNHAAPAPAPPVRDRFCVPVRQLEAALERGSNPRHGRSSSGSQPRSCPRGCCLGLQSALPLLLLGSLAMFRNRLDDGRYVQPRAPDGRQAASAPLRQHSKRVGPKAGIALPARRQSCTLGLGGLGEQRVGDAWHRLGRHLHDEGVRSHDSRREQVLVQQPGDEGRNASPPPP